MKNLKKYLKGFTLVELIIVITILAILGTIGFVSFQGYTRDARDANRLSNIQSIQKGFEIFQVTSGAYPQPDEATIYTGGLHTYIKQGVVGDQVSSLIKMTQVPVDPSNGQKYVYSVFGNTKYYQVAGEKESLSSSVFPIAYADVKSAIVRGNYTMDPSLPSLIMVPGSFTGSSIFHPNICFVVDGGENTLDTCYQTKSQMALNSFDKSLVGYWDMETTFNSGGTNYLKDLSGNGNHGVFSGNTLPTNTGGYFSRGLYFTGSNMSSMNSFIDISHNSNLNLENFTINVILKNHAIWNSNIILSKGTMDTWPCSFSGSLKCENYMINISSDLRYIHGASNFSGIRNYMISVDNVFENNKFFMISYRYGILNNNYVYDIFINGVKVNNKSNLTLGEKPLFNTGSLTIGGRKSPYSEAFNGIIDDIKIYNRALSDEEVAQQAKIAGF